MSKSFLANVSFLLLVNLLIKPLFIFGIDIPVQNAVGAEAYGYYFALFNFAFLFNMILDFGINNFTQRLVARNPDRVKSWLPNLVLVKLMLSLVFLILVFAVATGLKFEQNQLQLLAWICLNRILISFHMFFRSNIGGLQAFRTDALLSISDRLLTIILVGGLLYFDVLEKDFRIEDFVYATTAALLLSATLSWIALRIKSGPIGLAWNKRLIRSILLRSYPYAMLGVLMTLYNRIDSVMLERMLGENGDQQAGIYAAAYRLLDAATMFAFLIAGILLPLFARMIKERKAIWPILQLSTRLMFALSFTGAVCGALFATEIMTALYVEADQFWADTFQLLILGFVFNSMVYVFGSLLTADSKLRGLNFIALSGVALNIVLNLILIPKQQAYGAAVATLSTQALVAIAHLIYTARLFKWSGALLRELPRMALFSIIVCGIGWFLLQHTEIFWLIRFLALALAAAISALLTGLLNIKRIRTELVN
ncbi:MAG: O-antigen/teichoic acid export membrane protein [Limisphaerales bacterium]|jgi:O-antigen/teichoic acid export membrane protein